jgi:hypothetical protein
MKKTTLGFFLAFLLAACAPQASDLPTVRIVVSPAAQPVSMAIAQCIPRDESVEFSIEMQYPNTLDAETPDLLVRLGEPGSNSGFAVQLAWEKIELVVNVGNNVDISREAAADLFGGRIQNWSELSGQDLAVELWAGPASDEARQAFQANVLLGPVSGNTHLATNPTTALEAVANKTGAVAILPAAWADATVRRIDLGVRVPVIAITATEPTGVIRELLACLQSPVGQAELGKKYTPYQP